MRCCLGNICLVHGHWVWTANKSTRKISEDTRNNDHVQQRMYDPYKVQVPYLLD